MSCQGDSLVNSAPRPPHMRCGQSRMPSATRAEPPRPTALGFEPLLNLSHIVLMQDNPTTAPSGQSTCLPSMRRPSATLAITRRDRPTRSPPEGTTSSRLRRDRRRQRIPWQGLRTGWRFDGTELDIPWQQCGTTSAFFTASSLTLVCGCSTETRNLCSAGRASRSGPPGSLGRRRKPLAGLG
jgi:hypothetical protein